jgi:hypothetical protein
MEMPEQTDQVEQRQPGEVIADAAQAAADETVEAIDDAAKVNNDPVVARALDDAALKADKTSGRVGWLRTFVGRLFQPGTT